MQVRIDRIIADDDKCDAQESLTVTYNSPVFRFFKDLLVH